MSQISGLIAKVSALPNPAKQKISAILGAIVADAASAPLDWIYDVEKIKGIVGDGNPEFWSECKCPYFNIPTGNVSCYADETITSLKCISVHGSVVAPAQVATALADFFGPPDSPYQVALAKRADKKYPVDGPWIQGTVISFLKQFGEGVEPPGSADCHDNDGFTVSLPAILKDKSQAVQVAQLLTTNEMTLRHIRMQTQILENYLGGLEDPVAAAAAALAADIPEVCTEIEAVRAAVQSGKSLGEIIDEFGMACPLPGSFQGSVAALLLHEDYVSAVRQNILGGGDCCSRANFLGACLAAKGGVEVIPMDWIEKVHGMQEIIEAAIQVYQE